MNFAALTAICLALGVHAETNVYLKLSGQSAAKQAIPLVLASFEPEDAKSGEDRQAAQKLQEIVRADLMTSRWFDLREGAGSQAGAAARLTVKVGVHADLITTALVLKSLPSEDSLLERFYKDASDSRRALAHLMADDVVLSLTGKPGIAHTRIAFVNDKSGKKELYVIDYDGENLERLTQDHSIDLLPRWAPDRKALVYTSFKDGNPDLFRRDLETGLTSPLSTEQGLNIAGGFSPDGTELLMMLSRRKNPNLYIKNISNQTLIRLTSHTGADSSPTFSPDSAQIAFVSDRSGNPQIHILERTTGRVQRLTHLNWCDSPSWSPSGEWIAFAGRAVPTDPMDIFLVDVTGTRQRRLTRAEGSSEDPGWSLDGRFIVYTNRSAAGSRLMIMDADGSATREIGKIPGSSYTPSWSN